MIDGHQKAVDRLKDAEARQISPDLTALIDSLLPTVQHHLEMAQTLQGTLPKA